MSIKKVYTIIAKGSDFEDDCLGYTEKEAVDAFCNKYYNQFYPPYLDYGKWIVQNSKVIIKLSVKEK